ncbi:MAG: hypothetical protein WDM91_15030 [Rhizomicrobium sp.]
MDIEHRAVLRYAAEMTGTVLLLLGTKAAGSGLHLAPGSAAFDVLALAPLVPIWLMLLVTLRYYRRIDELQRLRFLQSASLTGGIMACLVWSYPQVAKVATLPPLGDVWHFYFSVIFLVVTAAVGWPRRARLRA